MSENFQNLLKSASYFLEQGEPFWCDALNRPASLEFSTFLNKNGFEVYHLFFDETQEEVYAPLSYDPDDLLEISRKRSELRQSGMRENHLPSTL